MIQMQKIHKRYASLVASGLMVLALTTSGFAFNDKTVTVMADGSAHIIKTHLTSTRGIAQDAGLTLDPKDQVISNTNTIQEGTVKTASQTVGDLAQELGYKEPAYTTKEDSKAAVVANMTVTIVKVAKHEVKESDRPIAVTETRQQDDSMDMGQTVVAQQGTPGVETVKQEVYYDADGNVIKTADKGTTVRKELDL